jgi:membrane protease YdiL (CAAX protease family)
MLRRPASEGILPAGVIAVVVTAGLFVLAHQLVSPVTLDVALSLSVLGLVTGSLVMFTGRIWPAVLVHVVYNLTGVGLTVLGTLLG